MDIQYMYGFCVFNAAWNHRSSITPDTLHSTVGELDLSSLSRPLFCYVTGRGKKDAGGGKPVKPERKQRMWWGEQRAASGELPLCVAFLLLPPDPAASLTTSPPLEKHKQLESPRWARASQNISQSPVETSGTVTRITCTSCNRWQARASRLCGSMFLPEI